MDQYTAGLSVRVHAGMSMVSHSAGCSTAPFEATLDAEVPQFRHDPLYRFQQWQANLRILEVTEIKSIPTFPVHPFVERLIGTLRREYLDHTLFWTTADLENKLLDFRTYFNNHRTHNSLEGERRKRPCHDQ